MGRLPNIKAGLWQRTMFHCVWIAVCALVLTFATSRVAHAQENLVGKRVTVIKDLAKLYHQQKEMGSAGLGENLTVKQVKGSFLWVDHFGGRYIRRADVVPYEKAVEYFTKKIEDDPTANNYVSRGRVWFHRGEFDIADGDFGQAIVKNDAWGAGYYYRGILARKKGVYDRALENFSMALERAASSENKKARSAVLNARGTVWNRIGEPDIAMADYTDAIQFDPTNEFAWGNRGRAWLKKNNNAKALSDLNEAIRLNPQNYDAYLNRGVVFVRDGRNDKAITDFSQAIEIDPSQAIAYTNLGFVFTETGRYAKAIINFKKSR